MFNEISWSAYWTVVVLLSTGYYLLVYLLFFRNDFQVSLPRSSPRGPEAEEGFTEKAGGRLEYEVYDCLDEAKAFLEQSAGGRAERAVVLGSLKKIFGKYPSLRATRYEKNISEILIREAEKHCALHLSEEEMVGLW